MIIQFENAINRFNSLILKELKDAQINCWIAGGSVRDYFTGITKASDYDLFFPSEEEYLKAKNYLNEKNAIVKWESNNGIKVLYNNNTFDLVKTRFFATPEDTIREFDFTVSMFAVDGNKVYHGETSFIDLSKKQLMINKITFPESTLYRAFKYYKKGFTMCAGEMKKIIEAIKNMPKEIQTENNNNTSSATTENEVISGDGFGGGFD